LTLIGGILLGTVGMFIVGVWAGNRDKARRAAILRSIEAAMDEAQEQEDVAVSED